MDNMEEMMKQEVERSLNALKEKEQEMIQGKKDLRNLRTEYGQKVRGFDIFMGRVAPKAKRQKKGEKKGEKVQTQ